jgi:hypothetical protein
MTVIESPTIYIVNVILPTWAIQKVTELRSQDTLRECHYLCGTEVCGTQSQGEISLKMKLITRRVRRLVPLPNRRISA